MLETTYTHNHSDPIHSLLLFFFFFPLCSTIPPLTSDHPFKMSAEELIRVAEVIVWQKGYKLLEADWQILAYPGNGDGQKTHAAVCGDVKVSLTKQTTVVWEARGRYVIMEEELTFVLSRDVRDEELAAVESILSGLVHCTVRDAAKEEASPTSNMGLLKNLAIGGLVGGAVVAATPFALGLGLGITAVGPTAGGLFAAVQSAGMAGGVAAAAQSTAMAGVATSSVVGGTTVGAGVGALFRALRKSDTEGVEDMKVDTEEKDKDKEDNDEKPLDSPLTPSAPPASAMFTRRTLPSSPAAKGESSSHADENPLISRTDQGNTHKVRGIPVNPYLASLFDDN